MGRDIQHQHHVGNQHQRQRGEHGSCTAALPTADARATQDRRGENQQQHAASHQRVARQSLRAQEHPAGAVKHAGQGVAEKFCPRDGNTVRECRVLVAADGVKRGAEARAFDQRPDEQRDKQDHERGRNDLVDQVSGQGLRDAVGDHAAGIGHDQQIEPEDDEHRGQGHHHRLEAHESNEEAVEGADRGAHAKARQAHQNLAVRGIARVKRDHDIDQRKRGAARQIEAANEEDDGLPHRSERQRPGIGKQEADFEIADWSRRDEVEIDENGDECANGDEQALLAREAAAPAQRYGGKSSRAVHPPVSSGWTADSAAPGSTPGLPSAWVMMFSSEMSSPRSSLTTRPRYITRIRSHIFTSSGISVE